MKRKRYGLGVLTLIFCLSLTVFPMSSNLVKAFSSQVIQRGATGTDVTELQSRLQNIGYYKGQIDGKFGWSTYWALRNFQQKFGLPVDGLAGATTKQMLVNHSSYTSGNANVTSNNNANSNSSNYTPTSTPNGYSANDIKLMSNAVYGESRGEPFIGQVAVAAVILHRVTNPKFPDTISGVIFQPGAFTAVQDGQIWLTPNDTARKAVLDAINGWDPSHGALYYFNPDTATSGWIWGRPQIEKIGKHIFTK
jgi:N-acetylmuramoyl-L-alanine amidase